MREVFSAVVVIGLVLVAVFVPVAFFPGTTGRLYQQFSLTIAFSVVLSVFNAVTLTPALSALLLDREPHAHGRFFRGVNRVIDAGTHGYVRVLRFSLTHRFVLILFFVASLGLTWLVFRSVPTSFVPAEDEGYFLSIVQAPAGASLEYTTRVAEQAEKVLFKDPGHPGRVLGDGLQLQRRRAEQRADLHAAQAVRRTPRQRRSRWTRSSGACAARSARSRARTSWCSRRRRSRACRRSAASSSRSSISRADRSPA